jgi:hypothetical protein
MLNIHAMRKCLFLFLISTFASFAQPSPCGTGNIMNQTLDSLQNDIIISSHVGLTFNLNDYLKNYNYNIHIPGNYTGNEPFGIVTFINAASNGNLISSWLPVLAEKKLILIAGNNIGNSVATSTRVGVVLAGLKALEQTLNIDSTRFYSSGASGGGRSASHLMFIFPEIFAGMIPNCGANYLRTVDQDYETHQPNSNYEYIYPYTRSQLDYVKSFNPVLSYLTAYDDFREGDIMNIYHNGAEPDGFRAKIMEISGNHCNTSTEHFRDGMNFLEHPFWEVLKDSFDLSGPITGNGFKLINASLQSNKLVLDPSAGMASKAYGRDPLFWNDPQGAILRASFRLDSLNFFQNSFLNLGFYDLIDTSIFNQSIGDSILSNVPGFLINYQFDSLSPKVSVILNSPKNGIVSDTIFSGRFSDFKVTDKQAIKLHLWQNEWRIEFNKHFYPSSVQAINAVKLLDDNRSVRIRPSISALWDTSDYQNGSLVSLSAGRMTANNSSTLSFEFFQTISADSSQTGVLSDIELNYDPSNFGLFPNPNKGVFNISSLNPASVEFSIYNSKGQLQLKHLHQGIISKIDLKNLAAGIYIMRSSQNDEQIKFIIKAH